ncbi:hypothetical protein DFH28DRAFT_947547 [Melampsora americana]|nr:hypothetical protein DFH28DRAFT_947547 [Melampsora americana]
MSDSMTNLYLKRFKTSIVVQNSQISLMYFTKEFLLGRFIDIRRIKDKLLNPKKGHTFYTASGKEKGMKV